MTQEFLYEKKTDGIVIWRCYGVDGCVRIPAAIGEFPVTALAPYACSLHEDRKKREALEQQGVLFYTGDPEQRSSLTEQAGDWVEEVQLPVSVDTVGRYAFYNCKNLERFHFSDHLKNLGAGAFTGCHQMKRLKVAFLEGADSCLKEILQEVHEALEVWLEKSGGESARLFFPQFYEEGVENTPARILMTRVHGSGLHFRNCFQQRQFDFKEYDRLFPLAQAQEQEGFVRRMAFARLRYPAELLPKARKQYLDYLEEHRASYVTDFLEGEEVEQIRWLLEELLKETPKQQKDWAEQMLEKAGQLRDSEAVSYLMDFLHRHTKPQRKSFDL